jgi:formate C-acetyltransferase
MTGRVAKLRSQSLSATPRIDMTRAKLYTEAYKLYEGTVSVPVLRAKAFYYYMQHNCMERILYTCSGGKHD